MLGFTVLWHLEILLNTPVNAFTILYNDSISPINTRKCQWRIWVIWRIAKQMQDRHTKLKFTAELCLEKVIFGRSENKLVFWEWKTKLIFEDAFKKSVNVQRKFTAELSYKLVVTTLGSPLNCPVRMAGKKVLHA